MPQDYDVITVGANQTKTFHIGSGDTFENKLIDISASGAHFRLRTSGSGWKVRNIGIRGVNDDHSDTYSCMTFKASDGGNGLVENIWAGDGSSATNGHAPISGYGNSGHVTIRNCYVEGWGASGMYLSQPGHPNNWSQDGGTFTVENCYCKNNNIENMRIGTPGSVIRDSVIHVEGTHAVNGNESGQRNPRGIWLKERDGLKVENCDIQVTGSAAIYCNSNGGGVVENCEIKGSVHDPANRVDVRRRGRNPDVSVPNGVPQSAEEAASGGVTGGSGGVPSLPDTVFADGGNVGSALPGWAADDLGINGQGSGHEITFSGNGAYSFEVSGEISPTGTVNLDDNTDALVSDTKATGTVAGYHDTYEYSGKVTSIQTESGVEYETDGEVSSSPTDQSPTEATVPSPDDKLPEIDWWQVLKYMVIIVGAIVAGIWLVTNILGGLLGIGIAKDLRQA